MQIKRFVGAMLVVTSWTLTTSISRAQEYPSKPIRVFPGSVGGGGDYIWRLIGPEVSTMLGQPIVIENRGGGSLISGGIVAKAPPDGYTLLSASNSLWTAPLLSAAPYDVARDFLPITLLSTSPQLLVVHPSMPVKTVKELIALARAKPGELNYAYTNRGGAAHLAAELFKALAGLNIVGVPYSSNAATLNAVLGGEITIAFDNTAVLTSHVHAKKLRALAVTTTQPSALAPGLPTVAGAGLAGFETTQVNGLFVPAKTSGSIINRLNQTVVQILNRPVTREKLFSTGVEVAATSPEQLATVVKAEIAAISKVIKDADIKAN